MAIFTGNWIHEGVPFIPGAHEHCSYSPGGSAQLAGQKPKWSGNQFKIRLYFQYAMVHYRSLGAIDKDWWEIDGMDRQWVHRHPVLHKDHGPAFFVRCRLPRSWAGAGGGPARPDWGGRRSLEIPNRDYFKAMNMFSIIFWNELELPGDPTEWVEFFELNPQYQHYDDPWNYAHKAHSIVGFPNGDEFQTVQFDSIFPPRDPPAYLRIRHGRGVSIANYNIECT